MAELKLWKAASNYMGEEYPDYYVLLGRSRDSGLLEEANFEAALKRLGGEKGGVKVARASHWVVGWVESILVHKDSKKAVEKAQEIADDLEQYPVLDDDLYYQKENEAAIENIRGAGYKYGLTENDADKILRWLEDNDVNTESVDDQGYYPNDDDLERAVKAIRKEKRLGKSSGKTKKSRKSPPTTSLRSMR